MILIIGSNEILGNSLFKYLIEKGYTVKGWDTSDLASWTNIDGSSKGWLDIDLLLDQLKEVNIVINCASYKSYLNSDYEKLLKINVEGMANLVNCCLHQQVDLLINLSHIEAFGNSDQEMVMAEEDFSLTNLKRSLYGFSRYLGDLELHRGAAEGLRTLILNCGYIIDMNNNIQPEFYKLLENGFDAQLQGRNGYLYIDDAINTIELLLLKNALNHNQFILISEMLDHNIVLSSIAEKVNTKLKPAKVGWLKRWKWSKKMKNGLGYSRDYLDQMNRFYAFSNARIKEELKVEFSKWNEQQQS